VRRRPLSPTASIVYGPEQEASSAEAASTALSTADALMVDQLILLMILLFEIFALALSGCGDNYVTVALVLPPYWTEERRCTCRPISFLNILRWHN